MRDPASEKVTMINPAAARNLRHVTGKAAQAGQAGDAAEAQHTAIGVCINAGQVLTAVDTCLQCIDCMCCA